MTEETKAKRDELATKYLQNVLDLDEDCLTDRTSPGAPVGEHIDHTVCGCTLHETYQSGFDAGYAYQKERLEIAVRALRYAAILNMEDDNAMTALKKIGDV